jgi:trans-2,3-dihydro-3-hydroxyanthranilate isomerase
MERHFKYFLVDVFTKTRLQGNPLAVFPFADGIPEIVMQQIAGELNLSETVFLCKATDSRAIARAKIFTPRRELNFAGHPTLGSAYVLSGSNPAPSEFAIAENIGLVRVETSIGEEGFPLFWLTTPPVKFLQEMDASVCARLLNLSIADVALDCPPQFASAGSPLLFVCLASPEAVDRAELQNAHLTDALGSVDSVGTFIFSWKGGDSGLDVYSRMFAPQTGIAEDPATGGATGPLAALMLKHGMLPRHNVHFTSEQGVKMGRPSLLHVKMEIDGPDVSIKVGGSVVAIAEGVFMLDV